MPNIDPKTGKSATGLTREECSQVFEELKKKYGVEINNSEMRIRFANGSFIKLDGADNYEAYRGVNPHIIVYDEYKDHHPKFHGAMDPNLATFDAPLLVVGTGPEGDEANAKNYYSLADYAKISEVGAYFNEPTWRNPYISIEFLKRKKAELIAKGEEWRWLLEYCAKRVKAGSHSIFPMFKAPQEGEKYTDHVWPRENCYRKVKYRHKDWEYFMSFDPASTSVFAVLFLAINKVTKEIVVLDEIYETDRTKTSTQRIWPRAMQLIAKYKILEDDVRKIYDYAAAWFANEVASVYGVGLEPCLKDINKKEDRLGLIKDIILGGYLVVSEDCPFFIWEMENYRTDEKGKIPKENDHNIDNLRYILAADAYNTVPPTRLNIDQNARFFTMERDIRESAEGLDPYRAIKQEYPHYD